MPAIAHRTRLHRAARPAKRLSSAAIAFEQRFAGPWQTVFRIAIGVIANTEFEWIDLQLVSQLIHRAVECKEARGFPWSAHVEWRLNVAAHEAILRDAIRARVEHSRCIHERLGVLLVKRRLRVTLMNNRRQFSIAIGAECDPLNRVRTMPMR